MRISDWSSDVCSSDLDGWRGPQPHSDGPIGHALLRLSIPIILGNLLQTAYQLTDAFWVGRLGASAVAAVAVNLPVTFLVVVQSVVLINLIIGLQGSRRSSGPVSRSEEHTSELQSLMRISYAVFGLETKKIKRTH